MTLLIGLLLWLVGAVALAYAWNRIARAFRPVITVVPSEETLFPAEKRLVSEIEAFLLKEAEKR